MTAHCDRMARPTVPCLGLSVVHRAKLLGSTDAFSPLERAYLEIYGQLGCDRCLLVKHTRKPRATRMQSIDDGGIDNVNAEGPWQLHGFTKRFAGPFVTKVKKVSQNLATADRKISPGFQLVCLRQFWVDQHV